MLKSKKDFTECLEKIISPLKNCYTEGYAGIKCGSSGVDYGNNVAVMEGFARILWGLAPFWGGKQHNREFERIYLTGIINGTNPEHKEYWGEIQDSDQRQVECAAFGLCLILASEKIWSPLTYSQKKNFYNWLNKINFVKSINNNWRFFAVIVNLGFKAIGMPYNKEVMEDSLSVIESLYIGEGWYTDGKTTQIDYYIAFAIHFYSLIYAKVMEHDDAERSQLMKSRAMEFANDFIYYFDEDGSAVAFGRSLTYRFAQCAFWSACVYAGIEPFPMGVMKGIISRNIEWWMDKPIFDNGGVLTIGYAYQNLCMSEAYNSPGSPYWGLKAFLVLALDDDHPFFEAECLPLPKLNKLHVIKKAKIVIQRVRGCVWAITAGQWVNWNLIHVAEKYSKFVYSSKYAFSVPRSYSGIVYAGTDNMLAFEKNNMCYVRRNCDESMINNDGSVYSKWSPIDGVLVETLIVPTESGHIRKHTVVTDEEYTAYECSFSSEEEKGEIIGGGETVTIKCNPNTNLIFPETKMKAIKYVFPAGKTIVTTEVIYPEA